MAYEPNDVYTVWLVEAHRQRQPGSTCLRADLPAPELPQAGTHRQVVLACQRDVYCDTLQGVIEAAYDRAIQEHNQGFIPLS